MRKPHDPERLENQGSAELTSILHALRSDGPSRASMQRMTQTLKNTFEAAPTSVTAVRSSSNRVLGKIGMTLLASGALFVGIRYATHAMSHAAPDARAAQAPSVVEGSRPTLERAEPQTPPEVVTRSTPQPELELRPSSTSRPERTAQGRRAPRARSARHARAAHVGSDMGVSRVPESAHATDSAEEHTAAPDPSSESDRVNDSSAGTIEPPRVQPAASSTPAPAAPEPERVAARPSEASLLQRARHLASERPAEALRILAEHARAYPNGLLAPEREVLAIQILRAQSRTSEAESRLAAFRERYPDSVYLERLEQRTQPR